MKSHIKVLQYSYWAVMFILLTSCANTKQSYFCKCNRKKENLEGKREDVSYYQRSYSDTSINGLQYRKYILDTKPFKSNFIRHDSINKKIYYLSRLSFEMDTFPKIFEYAAEERIIFDYADNHEEREIRLISLLANHISEYDKRIDSCTLGFKMKQTLTDPISYRPQELVYLYFNTCEMKISYVKFKRQGKLFECTW